MKKKILVIDDSATIRQQVSLALSASGFDVLEAADGVEGLRMILSDAEIRAAICDVNMPHKNGLELVEELQATGLAPDLPIVMLTTEGQPELIQRAKAAGAKGWIVKPFKANLLVAAVKKMTA